MGESRSSLSSSVKLENDERSAFVSGVIYLLANETPFSVSDKYLMFPAPLCVVREMSPLPSSFLTAELHVCLGMNHVSHSSA